MQNAPGWYFLTLAAAERGRNVFAEIGPTGFRPTALGRLAERAWRSLSTKRGPALVTHTFQLMPDHVHVLVHATGTLPRTLGSEIGGYKAAVTSRARRELGFVSEKPLWESGFHCERKKTPEEVARSRLYAERNPATARKKREAKARWGAAGPVSHPRLPAVWPIPAPVEGPPVWSAFGNRALLDAEKLVPVRVSGREPEDRLKRIENRAASLAREGAVLVSPAVSPGEKRALAAALRAGGRAIHLENRPIDLYYKPGPARLAALAEGRFLAASHIAPGSRPKLTRLLCEALNALARALSV